MEVHIFRIRPFLVENIVLGISTLVFIPTFFFASEYAQISLGKSASQASLVLLYYFLGFVVAAQIGGRMLDRVGAKRPVVLGCVLSAVGYALWAGKVTELSLGSQVWFIVLAGAGMGFMLGPASTDAVNRASRLSYGEATGITQTVRNYTASLGLAILGTLLVTEMRTRTASSLVSQGVPSGAGLARGVADLTVAGERGRRADPALHPPRFRERHALGAHRDGRRDGGGRRRGDPRAATRRAGRVGSDGSRVIEEAPLGRAGEGLSPTSDGWFVVNAREARWLEGDFGAYTRFEGRGTLPAARDQHRRARARPARVHVPRRGRAGGLPRPLRRVPAADRGRGAPAEGMGFRPLPSVDGARLRRRRHGPLRDPRSRLPAPAAPSCIPRASSHSDTAPASRPRRGIPARHTRASGPTRTSSTARAGCRARRLSPKS